MPSTTGRRSTGYGVNWQTRGRAGELQGVRVNGCQHLLRKVLALLLPHGLRKEGKQVTQKQYYELAKILSTIADPVEREQIGRAVAALCREIKPTYDANGNARLNQQHFMADVTGYIDLKRA